MTKRSDLAATDPLHDAGEHNDRVGMGAASIRSRRPITIPLGRGHALRLNSRLLLAVALAACSWAAVIVLVRLI